MISSPARGPTSKHHHNEDFLTQHRNLERHKHSIRSSGQGDREEWGRKGERVGVISTALVSDLFQGVGGDGLGSAPHIPLGPTPDQQNLSPLLESLLGLKPT